jgi:hypothetical protein
MPVIDRGDDHFQAGTYTGNGSTQTISGLRFQPDFVWIKQRSGATWHALYDVNRGVTKSLASNATDAEDTRASGLTAFNSDGFTLGSDNNVNGSGNTYVYWAWKANGSGVSNTDGTITSTVSANTTAGFSVVTYAGGSSGSTVGHGLGVSPVFVIFKNRSTTSEWRVYSSQLGSNNYLELNTTAASASDTGWMPTPSSTVLNLTGGNSYNNSGSNHVAYCFAPVAGYSAFGSYSGSGSQPGPFTYLGFKPAFIIIKESNGADGWGLYDDGRDTYNPVSYLLQAQDSGAESSASANKIDFLSNGFRVCTDGTQGNFINESGKTYIYAAWASNPFKYALAR